MKSLVSVIIPTYNRAKYLPDCIKSVLNQKPGNFSVEVIVVDDGSTDDTDKALSAFKGKIRYKKIANSGRPAIPRNIGINMAKGDLIAFQDSDDLWVADKLNKQLPVFNDPSVVLSYGNTEIVDEKGIRTGKTVITNQQAHSGDIFCDLTKLNFISTLTVMARKNSINEAGLFNESPEVRGVEDYELWLRLSRLGKVQFLDKILAYYRHHDQNISTGSVYEDAKKILNIMRILEKLELTHSEKKAIDSKKSSLYAELRVVSKFPETHYWLLKRALAKLSR